MERKTQPLPSEAPEVGQEVEIPLDKAKRLFFQSFRFSQGTPMLQHMIFDYLHLIRPEWHMSDSLKEQVDAEVREPIFKFLTAKTKVHKELDFIGATLLDKEGPGKKLLTMTVDDNINNNLKRMQKAFNTTNLPFDMLFLTSQIVRGDYKFLHEWNGRPRDSDGNIGAYRPSMDQMLSHICYYGFEGNSTGEEEFDQMFNNVSQTAIDILQDVQVVPRLMEPFGPKTKERLVVVVNKYAETHPQSVPKLKSLGFPLGHIA